MKRYRKYVAMLNAVPITKKVRHYQGFPDQAISGAEGSSQLERNEFGIAAKLLIEENESGVFLYRLSKDDLPVGDTWHASVEDAMKQASFEFDELVGDWTLV